MSYCALVFFRNGEACELTSADRFDNAHGCVIFVWDALLQKYRRKIFPKMNSWEMPVLGANGGWEALWAAKIEYRWWERLVLEFTYDNKLVKGGDADDLADAMIRFTDALWDTTVVCHLPDMAKRIRALFYDRPFDAVGLHATSVNTNPWSVGERNSETDDFDWRPYDLARDVRHTFVVR